jgi:hypothetical protein
MTANTSSSVSTSSMFCLVLTEPTQPTKKKIEKMKAKILIVQLFI